MKKKEKSLKKLLTIGDNGDIIYGVARCYLKQSRISVLTLPHECVMVNIFFNSSLLGGLDFDVRTDFLYAFFYFFGGIWLLAAKMKRIS